MLTFYGYKKCGTSRKGEQYLQERGIAYSFIDVTENPPSLSALKKMMAQSGVETKKLFNTSGKEYRESGMKDRVSSMTRDEVAEVLAGNGRLIKRPVITDGSQTTVGFDEKIFSETWG